ncbi:ChaB family protein [Nostoc sp.]|uniref:ChaB family protein n=1 Tax=Nostoc sp. TaxID=1180 RepID=UPI002FFC79E3
MTTAGIARGFQPIQALRDRCYQYAVEKGFKLFKTSKDLILMKAESNMAFHPKAKDKYETGEIKVMPYKQIADLPDSVKENLPKHAQEIFRAAFNSAQEQYSGEESAFRVAWGGVKRDYEKGDDGHWHKKPE